tara:strand:- start:4272 stop:4982 length:711 start_codon:yes stop_codon:yes gene_type:complete
MATDSLKDSLNLNLKANYADVHKALHNVLGNESLSKNTFKLIIERGHLNFRAGQCVNLGLPNSAINREYSTYSGEKENELEFLIREVEDGDVSPALRKLNRGDTIEIDGAYGLFTLPESKPEDRSYVFVATGTGIAPFHCFIRSISNLDYTILHGTRLNEENYEIGHYAEDSYIHCVSKEKGGNFEGRVTDYLRQNPQGAEKHYYLCGNRNMANEVYDILREQKVSGSNIITEVFF